MPDRSPLALIAYQELDTTVHVWARLARALARIGHAPLYVDAWRRPTAGELLRIAASRGAWAPPCEPAREDGVTVVRPIDLNAQRFEAAALWDRRSLEQVLLDHAPTGWAIVFSSAIGKPWPRPEGWRLCYFPVDDFADEDAAFAEREERILNLADQMGYFQKVVNFK